jgi:RNase H
MNRLARIDSARRFAVRLYDRSVQIYIGRPAVTGSRHRCILAISVCYPEHLALSDEVICEMEFEAETADDQKELKACVKALEWVRKNKPWKDVTSVQIVTTSPYVIDNVKSEIFRRCKKVASRDRLKKNRDLWKQLLSANQRVGIPVDFIKAEYKPS